MNQRFAVVAAYSDGRDSLWATTPAAKRFRRIGPRLPPSGGVEDIDFLDDRTGWFLTFDPSNDSEREYRTTDGGRHWRSFSAPGHTAAARSYDTLDFLTRRVGWLTDFQPTGSGSSLYATRDAGASWHPVKRRDVPAGYRPEVLPNEGPAEFTSAVDGFESGVSYITGATEPTFVTSNGGLSWHRASVPYGRRSLNGPLTVSHGHATAAVFQCGKHPHLRLFTHASHRNAWSPSPPLKAAPTTPECEASISVPTSHTTWALIAGRHSVTVARLDSSAHWHVATPRTLTGERNQLVIQSADANDAWIIFQQPRFRYLLITTNAGRTWRRARLPST